MKCEIYSSTTFGRRTNNVNGQNKFNESSTQITVQVGSNEPYLNENYFQNKIRQT